MKPLEPGIYPGVPFGDYLRWPAVNNSSLKPMTRSPAHYHWALAHPRPSSEAQSLGTFCHAGLLEPLTLLGRFVVMPDLTEGIVREDGTPYAKVRGTGQYKGREAAWREQNADKQVVSLSEYDQLSAIYRNLAANERWRMLTAGAQAEVSFAWIDPDTGILCKGRTDLWNESLPALADFKTAEDASDIAKTTAKWFYHRQAAFYTDGMEVLTGNRHRFWLAYAETGDGPHCVRVRRLGAGSILTGRKLYRSALRQIAACRESGEWPGYDDQDETFDVPGWALNQSEETEHATLARPDSEPTAAG